MVKLYVEGFHFSKRKLLTNYINYVLLKLIINNVRFLFCILNTERSDLKIKM